MLTGDRVEYLPEAGKNIDISNSLKIYLTMLCMLGEAKPSFFREKEVLNANLIWTQARFSILLLLMFLFSTGEIFNNKQQIVVLEA